VFLARLDPRGRCKYRRLTLRAKARVKDLTLKAKANELTVKAKDLTLNAKAKATAKDLTRSEWLNTRHGCKLLASTHGFICCMSVSTPCTPRCVLHGARWTLTRDDVEEGQCTVVAVQHYTHLQATRQQSSSAEPAFPAINTEV